MQKAYFLKLSAIAVMSAVLMAPQIAKSDSNEDEGSHWLFEARYQKSFNETSDKWKDYDTGTPVLSTTGEEWNNLDSYGIAIGHSFGSKNTNISLGYEILSDKELRFATASDSGGVCCTGVKFPMDITNIMIELTHNIPITDNSYLIGLIGVGQSTIDSDRFTVNGTIQGTAKEVTNTSTRFGIGAAYLLSENVHLIGMLQQSDYGDGEVTQASGFAWKNDVSTSEASIRLRWLF